LEKAVAEEAIGGYRLLKHLVTGQTSQVWEVVEVASHRHFGMKMLLPEKARDPMHRQLLAHEAEVGKELAHPNIIKIVASSMKGDTPYIVMEFFPAGNLKLRLIRKDLTFIRERCQDILKQAATALAFMNAKGWVHRDVKPDNLLVNSAGELRLIDFALAQRIAKGGPHPALVGAVGGILAGGLLAGLLAAYFMGAMGSSGSEYYSPPTTGAAPKPSGLPVSLVIGLAGAIVGGLGGGVFGRMLRKRTKAQGTRSYMSPEQIRGQPLDGRADIYSFAASAYELATGRPPFRGMSNQDLLNKHITEKPVSPQLYNPDITDEFAALVLRMLSKKKQDRPRDFHEVLMALRTMRVFKTESSQPTRK
jgi:serine/threonine protein kinase